ncbi:MAG: hypothetical protein N4Q30_07930, partial [Neisseriaceae bacterium]|nr:hypothetical protein [Neisseriaceae bacterium]
MGFLYALFRIEINLQSRVDDRNELLSNVPLFIEVISIPQKHANSYQFYAKVLDSNKPYKKLIISDFTQQNWPL